MPVCVVVLRKIHRVISCYFLIPAHFLNHFHKPLMSLSHNLLHCLSCVHLTSSVSITSCLFLPPDFIFLPSPAFLQGSQTDSITVATNCDTLVLTNSASFLSRVCACLSLHFYVHKTIVYMCRGVDMCVHLCARARRASCCRQKGAD